jgi:hypothetical protein
MPLLQFLKEKYASVSVQMIESIGIGQKDQHKSLFAVWETVFRTIEQKKLKATRGLDTCGRSREATMYGIGEGGDGEVGRFVTRVSNCISGGVEYEKVMQGESVKPFHNVGVSPSKFLQAVLKTT